MTHQDAVHESAVERYLLGELTGAARERFEDHLFDCIECADEVKLGIVFADAARTELQSPEAVQATASTPAAAPARPFLVPSASRPASRTPWWAQPWILAPALAACLMVIVYQSVVAIPRLKTQVADSRTPAVLNNLLLANAGARGTGTLPEIAAPAHGYYLLSVDIPPAAGAKSYRCTLLAPSGSPAWHIDVSAQQARDTITIQVPAIATIDGMNELHVQGLLPSEGQNDTLVDLATYRYQLHLIQ